MALSLDTLLQAEVEHEETKTRYTIRPLSVKDMKRLRKKAIDQATGEVDSDKLNALVCDEAIIDWSGVFLGQGETEAEATSANKKKFGENLRELADFIFGNTQDFRNFQPELDAAKNG